MTSWRGKVLCDRNQPCDCRLFLWACCCSQCVYSQLASIAVKFPATAVKQWDGSSSSVCCGVFVAIAVVNLIGYALYSVQSAYIMIFAVAFSSASTIVLCLVRQRFRVALDIDEEAACYDTSIDDCCCAAWCGPCTALQLFWHVNVSTSDNDSDPGYAYKRVKYKAPCASDIADTVGPATRDSQNRSGNSRS